MCEDVARTVHVARQLGEPLPIEPDDVAGSTTATRTSTDNADRDPHTQLACALRNVRSNRR